jgi:hypothetical protein
MLSHRFRGKPVPTFPHDALFGHRAARRKGMGKGILLWLIGVPIPVIILLWLIFH